MGWSGTCRSRCAAGSRRDWTGGLARRTAVLLRRLSALDDAAFDAALPASVGAVAAGRLHAAVRAIGSAKTLDDERAASAVLADAVQAVGIDGWARFVAAAQDKNAQSKPAQIIQAQEFLPDGMFSEPPEEFVPRNMERIPGQSGKEAASDIPSWARGIPRQVGETPRDYAKRLMDGRYGKGRWEGDRSEEYNKIKKWGSRAWRNPRMIPPADSDGRPQA